MPYRALLIGHEGYNTIGSRLLKDTSSLNAPAYGVIFRRGADDALPISRRLPSLIQKATNIQQPLNCITSRLSVTSDSSCLQMVPDSPSSGVWSKII